MGNKLGTPDLLIVVVILFVLAFSSTSAFSEVIELSPTRDTYVNSRKSTKSYNSSKYIRIRESRRSQRLGLLEFDLSDIAPGSTIEKAELWLYVRYKRGSGILTVSEITQDWEESVSWNDRPDSAGLAEDSVNANQSGIYYRLDLTNLAQDWADGVVENNGISLALEDKAYIIINSVNNSANRPKLKITYTEPETGPVAASDPDPDPINTIQPHPNPEPQPEPVADTGVSDAPLNPADKRILVVSKDGSGNYRKIQDAVDDSRPGDTIQVKDGIYEERVNMYVSGTKELPIALINYPGHSPVIDPGGGQYPTECCPEGGTQRVEINAKWVIVEGFEIRYGWEGIKIYKDHNTIRGNWIHHNYYSGILVVSASDVFISGNTINNNGTDEGTCLSGEKSSPKHCHGVYFSEYHCEGMSNNSVRANNINNHGGRAIQWNGSKCDSNGVIRNTLVENNILENNSWGMALYYNTQDSLIINNTIVIEDYPQTNDTSHTLVGIYGSPNNIFMNNIFQSSREDIMPLVVIDAESTQSIYDYNLWNTEHNTWVWGGDWRNDFHNYMSVSGWDSNGMMDSDPGFVNSSGGDYHIKADSLARNSGNNSYCSQTDIDNEPRNASSEDICDIGADERY